MYFLAITITLAEEFFLPLLNESYCFYLNYIKYSKGNSGLIKG